MEIIAKKRAAQLLRRTRILPHFGYITLMKKSRMLDVDLLPKLRSNGVKGRTFSKNRNQRSCLLPWSFHRSKIELFNLRPSILGGGGTHKTTSGSHYLVFEPWTEMLRRSNTYIIQKQEPSRTCYVRTVYCIHFPYTTLCASSLLQSISFLTMYIAIQSNKNFLIIISL